MHAWLAAVADSRIACTAPIMGVQGFEHAMRTGTYHARVASIPQVRCSGVRRARTSMSSARAQQRGMQVF